MNEDSGELLPPKWRLAAYRVYSVVGILLGAVAVGYSTAVGIDNLPPWLLVTNAVYVFLGGPFGFVAQRNVPQVGRHAA